MTKIVGAGGPSFLFTRDGGQMSRAAVTTREGPPTCTRVFSLRFAGLEKLSGRERQNLGDEVVRLLDYAKGGMPYDKFQIEIP